MAESTNYQCPSCTAPLHFSAKTNKLECDYCGSSYEISEIDKLYAEKIKKSVDKGMDSSEAEKAQTEALGTDSYKTYTCSSCGAQLFCDTVTVAAACPYCGNPNVIAGKFHGGEMPDLVIPFKMEKKDAVQKLSEFYKGKKLLPKVFSAENHIEEVKGVYVPFWLYSGKADVKLECDAQNSEEITTANERIERISHYKLYRSGVIPFEKIPVDASKKMDNAIMDSLEPFDYSDLKNFTPSYLPGFFAEAHDETDEDCVPRLKKRLSESSKNVLLADASYDSVQVKNLEMNLDMTSKPAYTFLPVWLLSTKWKDKNYLFAMNGQTGKFVGKLPVDGGKVTRIALLVLSAGALILTPLIYFILMKL